MSRSRFEPGLPKGLRFAAGATELVVQAGNRRERIPVSHLPAGSVAVVKRIVSSREPHVLVAPRFTSTARGVLTRPGWGWIDHDGNLRIERDGLLLDIATRARGTRARAQLRVSPQGERVVRHLLDHYPHTFRWTEIAQATRLDRGYTSRVLRRLEEHGLIHRERGQPIRLPYPTELFEVWQAGGPRLVETAWSSSLPVDQIVRRLHQHAKDEELAFTGVFAAARLTRILEPERVEAYVLDLRAARRFAAATESEETERGANLVLLIHRDPGVLSIGSFKVGGLPFASKSQIYKDAVQRARGRETEAGAAFRRQSLTW